MYSKLKPSVIFFPYLRSYFSCLSGLHCFVCFFLISSKIILWICQFNIGLEISVVIEKYFICKNSFSLIFLQNFMRFFFKTLQLLICSRLLDLSIYLFLALSVVNVWTRCLWLSFYQYEKIHYLHICFKVMLWLTLLLLQPGALFSFQCIYYIFRFIWLKNYALPKNCRITHNKYLQEMQNIFVTLNTKQRNGVLKYYIIYILFFKIFE